MNKHFITKPAYISVELNAHNLLYLVLLVKQQYLPKETLIHIPLFNSQTCESFFRDARSFSNTFSTMNNFTVKGFLRRSEKISLLNQFKYDQLEKKLSFPIHHKHKQRDLLASSYELDDIDMLDIMELISSAYDKAIHLLEHSKIVDTLSKHNINCLSDLSSFIFNLLSKNSRMINYSFQTEDSIVEEFGLDEENEDNDVANDVFEQSTDELFDYEHDLDFGDGENILNTRKSDFTGIRIVDKINPSLRASYFKVKINGNIKYLHKQSAYWLQSTHIVKLSSDRLSRVMQRTFADD